MNASTILVTTLVFVLTKCAFATGNTNVTTAIDFNSRIFNGYPAAMKHTRHQVSIRLKLLDSFIFGLGHLCGGSLISPSVVLTAAHCLRNSLDVPINETSLVVAMGTQWRNVSDSNTLVYNVKKYVSHPNYNRSIVANDIAYIILDGKVPANHSTVQPIGLVDSKVPVNTLCQVSGWGITEENIPSDRLLAVDVRIIDINVCNQGYEGTLHVIGQLCAGYMDGVKDACVGDSGGPLVCDGKLIGIVSFGEGCGQKNKPGVYTDILYYKDWILKGGSTTMKTVPIVTLVSLLVIVNFV